MTAGFTPSSLTYTLATAFATLTPSPTLWVLPLMACLLDLGRPSSDIISLGAARPRSRTLWPRELAASALRCLASFERLTSRLYEHSSRKTSNRLVSLVFEWLSTESDSHAILLDTLASPSEAEEEDCAEFVGLP